MGEFLLTTSRLGLREMTMDDLDFMATMLGDQEVTRFYPKAYSREEAVEWIERQRGRYLRDGHGLWLVVEREAGAPVGQAGLVVQQLDDGPELEIGYMIHRHFWRRGLASEAALAVRDHAFANQPVERVVSLVRPENVPSQRTALRIGMKPERTTFHHGLPHLVFSVSREHATTSREG